VQIVTSIPQIAVELRLPAIDSKMAGKALAEAVNALADANSVWFARQKDVPECSSCAGFTYANPPMSTHQVYHSAQAMLENPTHGWSCVELVAYDVGLLRANTYAPDIVVTERAPFDYHFTYDFAGYNYDPSDDIVNERVCVCAA
jgi:hypothetical protein